jgi:hypothetical protein
VNRDVGHVAAAGRLSGQRFSTDGAATGPPPPLGADVFPCDEKGLVTRIDWIVIRNVAFTAVRVEAATPNRMRFEGADLKRDMWRKVADELLQCIAHARSKISVFVGFEVNLERKW